MWLFRSYTAHMALGQCYPFQNNQQQGYSSFGLCFIQLPMGMGLKLRLVNQPSESLHIGIQNSGKEAQ